MEFEWETEYRPSWLVLKQKAGSIIVARLSPYADLGPNMARIYDGWVNGEKVYDAAKHFRVGQKISAADLDGQ